MRLLLDTHVFIWSVTGSRRLSTKGRALLASADAVFVSAASIWEIAIKARLGKIDGDVAEFAATIDSSGYHELAITTRHTAAVASLPLHHRDPFDRLLLAQSMIEPLRFITTDHAFTAYGVSATEL